MLVWKCGENGEFAADDGGNIMHVFLANPDDKKTLTAATKALESAARSYGFPPGRAVFLPGRRPIDDEELENQLSRASAGLTPDILDPSGISRELNTLADGS